MPRSRYSLVASLSVFSIVLLLALQAAWLTSAWREAKRELTREVNLAFRTTVLAQHDSLISRSIQAQPNTHAGPSRFVFMNDSVEFPLPEEAEWSKAKHKTREVRVEIFSASRPADSMVHLLRPITRRLNRDSGQQKFIIRLGPDSLNIDTLTMKYHAALEEADILLPATVFLQDRSARFPNASIITDPVPLNPLTVYRAAILNTNNYLAMRILPQVLFSLFLTAVTVAAFVLLNASVRKQQRLMALRNDLVSNITHELKTPIATVSVALEALKDFDVLKNPQRTREYLDMASNELHRLALLTENVLRVSLAENQKPDYLPQPVDMATVVNQVTGAMRLLFEKRQAQVEITTQGTDFTVMGSDIHLSGVLFNLLDNALKYSPNQPTITVKLVATADGVTLHVKDAGAGIPREYQEKIFDKFFRVPHGDIHNTRGHGLGLNFVKATVTQHHGTVRVVSAPGMGSEFIVTLPHTPAHG